MSIMEFAVSCSSKLYPPPPPSPIQLSFFSSVLMTHRKSRTTPSISTSLRSSSSSSSSTTLSPSKTTTKTTTTLSNATKRVLVPIGIGTEEMEAVILVNVLRRAGAEVTVASVEPHLQVQASAGIILLADTSISTCSHQYFHLVALPGGMPGSVRLRDCEILKQITTKQAAENRLYGAISAAPAMTLVPWGLTKRKKTTCHPAFKEKLPSFWAVTSNIQVSGQMTTSRGPGTSFEFALSLVDQLFGESIARELGESLLMHTSDGSSVQKEFNKIEWSLDHTPHVLIPVANGSEEIEIVTIVDILRRAKITVTVASIEKTKKIRASQGTKLISDKLISEAAETTYDLIILPLPSDFQQPASNFQWLAGVSKGGNAGVEKLQKSRILKKLLNEQDAGGRIFGAVCSSAAVLHKYGLLKEKKVTAHPSVLSKLTNEVIDGAQVVIDGRLITSKGLATVTDFSLAIVSKLFGHSRARSVAQGLVLDYPKGLVDLPQKS